ncbi:GNAT family N-acetyltransferase [Radiobacillus kanasensis]|uniref:GNAT family N-acetyltransferase n=1 Tax=Radiobacillus kanasensis TaxID=2844358 RepID=UPI001E32A283|nr:GNAT family N-acetyltransferase [Radiobacillus kanasensis]UFT99717.1 GNAT family N-acetyltransferase [Radiobacillus kanasensis]
MFKLRQANEMDFTSINHLLNQEYGTGMDWKDKALIQTIVVEDQGELVAFTPIQFAKDSFYLPYFFVKKEYIRKGIAQHLFEKVKKLARANQVTTIQMAINLFDEETIHYYKERLVMEREGKLLVI